MGPTADMLVLVKARFPGREDRIERAFWRQPGFRSLCLDFRDCVTTMERLRERGTAEAIARQLEYADVLADLMREIESWLAEHDDLAPEGRADDEG